MLKRLAIVGVLGAFLLGKPCVAEDQQGKTHAEEPKGAQIQQPVPPTHIVIDPSSATVHVETKATDDKQTSPDEPLPRFLRPEWVIVYITAVYVAITAWMLIVIGNQAGYMKEQTEILRGSVAAAQNSADAAMAQVQMMVAKERASIEITFAEDSDAMVVRPDEMVRVGSFHLNMKNVGGTAAKNIAGWYDTFASEEEKAPKIEDKFWLAPPATVEGNAWEPIPAPLSIDPRFTADRAPELFYVYLRGEITYNDIFKKEPNFTRFLLRRQFIRGGIGEAIPREFWGPAGEGENEST